MGLLTDSVEEVIDIEPGNIEPPPKIGTKVEADFIKGMGKINEEFIIILNIDRVLDAHELIYIADAQKSGDLPTEKDDEKAEKAAAATVG